MKASVTVKGLSKTFMLSQAGGGPVTFMEVLRFARNGASTDSINALTTTTREVHALKDVSFHIEEGERVGIIGSNGAGKTTLLSILAGMSDATAGTCDVEGDVHAMLTIGAVLREEMTGRENVYLDAAVHGRTREEIDLVADEIIEFSELEEFIDRPVRTYSSGMKARLAFSMGAFISPDILILDETLSVGDAFFAQKASKLMKEVAEKGRIVIIVSHGTSSIVEMCNRCLWLNEGRLIMDGDPKEVTTAYEKSVSRADEDSLKKKFTKGEFSGSRTEIGTINEVSIHQDDKERQANVASQTPLSIGICGTLKKADQNCDLLVRLVRVDGREVWHSSLKAAGNTLPSHGEFEITLTMDPFILGANLYRLDIELVDNIGVCDTAIRVFEVIEEEKQFGGEPFLLYPPTITSRRKLETRK